MLPSKAKPGFTLVELLVVIGIIATLIAILLPALARARAQSMAVQCESNMRQVGMGLLQYIDQDSGYLFPNNMGWGNNTVYLNAPNDGSLIPAGNGQVGNVVLKFPDQWQSYTYNTWPVMVFGTWDPPYMMCPTEAVMDPPPNARHTYILNAHLADPNTYKYGQPLPNHLSPSQAILMGEKISYWGDYYMNDGDYGAGKVDEFKHGLQIGSNYLFVDMHVESKIITADDAQFSLDPWNLGSSTTTSNQ